MNITTYRDAIEAYDNMLDDVYGEPMGYPASRVLRSVDPIAYRVGFFDYLDGEDIDPNDLSDYCYSDLP